MPIYAYRCASCGHSRDVLQKISDPVLSVCPACGAEQFQKQITAAGFQLKGSGWYVTDFRNNGGGSAAGAPAASPASGDGAASAPAPAPASAPASEGGSSAAPPASTSASCGGGCACH
jgi:putative FmdB family regulatory protein